MATFEWRDWFTLQELALFRKQLVEYAVHGTYPSLADRLGEERSQYFRAGVSRDLVARWLLSWDQTHFLSRQTAVIAARRGIRQVDRDVACDSFVTSFEALFNLWLAGKAPK